MGVIFSEQKPQAVVGHYTPKSCVEWCVGTLKPIIGVDDTILDPCCGTNHVWTQVAKEAGYTYVKGLDIEFGDDYLQHQDKYDWVIGNPPYHLFWKFCAHAAEYSQKGFAFLCSSTTINSFTPKRLGDLQAKYGYSIRQINIMNVKRWRGRYFFVVVGRENVPFNINYAPGSFE